MGKHKHGNITEGKVCTIIKCSCGIYHIHYQFLTMKLNHESMFRLLKVMEEWDNKTIETGEEVALQIRLGIMCLDIPAEDVTDFSNTMQEALMQDMELPDFFNSNIKEPGRNCS